MKQLFRSIRSNNKQSKLRDFIGESLNLAKPTDNQNTHLEAGHSSHHYSNSGEITEQEQPLELEIEGASNTNNTTKNNPRDNRLSFENQESFKVHNSTKLEDPLTDNQLEQNTAGPDLRQPIRSFKQQGFSSKGFQTNPNESPDESPNEYQNQDQFDQKSKRFGFSKPNLMAREDQNGVPQSRTDGEHEAGEEGGSPNPFSKGLDQQSFSKVARQYDFGQSIEPSDLSIGIEPSDLSIGSLFDFGYTRIYDASHDGTKKEVFEDGAIRINYDGDFLNNNRLDYSDIFGWSWGPSQQ